MADYQLPSSFVGGIQGASNALSAGKLPQGVQSPILKQILPTPKPAPVDPNLSPEVFKKRFIEKNGDGVSSDGRKYSTIPAPEIVVRIIRKLGNGTTTDGKKYSDFLPRPASPSDSLEYRLSQIEKTAKTAKGVSDFMQAPGTNIASSIKQTAGEMFKGVTQPVVGLAKGVVKGVTDVADIADLSMEKAPEDRGIIQKTLANVGTGVKDLATRDIQAFQEAPGVKTGLNLFNPISEKKVGSVARVVNRGLSDFFGSAMETALTPEAQQTVATTLAPIGALFEKVLSVVPEGDKRDTAEALLNLLPIKVPGAKNLATGAKTAGAKGMSVLDTIRTSPVIKPLENVFSTSTTKNKVPKSVKQNLEVIQNIKTGVTGNKVLKQAKNRGFDPELDIATYEDLKPTITNDGRVNTDVAQENLQNFIEPYQEKLDNAIAQEGEFVSADVFRREILKELESEKSNIRNYEGWVNTANNAVDTAVRNFGDSNGNIPLSEVNNIKKKLGSNNNYLDPNITLDKTIARAAKQIVEDYTKSADVKALNNDLARWYTTREYLQILGSGTKTVKGGRLGKYAARLAGVVIGSQFGPMAGWVGGEVAAKLQSKMMQGALKGTKQAMPEMKSFGNIKKKQQLLLPPPSGITPSGNVVDVKPMTGYSPGVLNKNNNAISRQTSSNTTVSPQSPVPPVQVLEGTRKTPVIPAKTKSKENLPGKKVNNSIIDGLKKKKETAKNSIVENLKKKKEVKANLPKTPQVEGKTVDPELLSLQKSQESLPGLPKVEVPADYVPKDGLPTGTEFEAPIISSISKTKGKLPSPDIKRPQIRGIDLGIRSNMIDSLKEEGIFTDSFFAISDKNLSNKFIEYAEQKAIKKGVPTTGKEVSMTRLLDIAKNSADTTLTPKEYVKFDGDKGIYLRFDIGDGNKVAVNSSYTDIFFKNFDDVTFKGSNEVSPVVVYSKGKDVGIIMPIKDPYASKEVLGDFTTTTANKPSLPMSQKSDVGKTDDYFYHGTSQGAFEQIQKEGIKPQRRGVSSFSKTEEYSRNWAYPEATGVKGAMLRVKKSYMEGKLFNTKKPRPKSDELYEVLTKETIPPEALEVLKDGKWQPLVKPKPSLPLSSKSEVKYSEAIDSERATIEKKHPVQRNSTIDVPKSVMERYDTDMPKFAEKYREAIQKLDIPSISKYKKQFLTYLTNNYLNKLGLQGGVKNGYKYAIEEAIKEITDNIVSLKVKK